MKKKVKNSQIFCPIIPENILAISAYEFIHYFFIVKLLTDFRWLPYFTSFLGDFIWYYFFNFILMSIIWHLNILITFCSQILIFSHIYIFWGSFKAHFISRDWLRNFLNYWDLLWGIFILRSVLVNWGWIVHFFSFFDYKIKFNCL